MKKANQQKSAQKKSPRRQRRSLKRTNGEGTVTARYNSQGEVTGWKAAIVVGLKPDGQYDRRWVSAKTQQEVVQKIDSLKVERNTGSLPNSNGMTVEQFAQFWLANKPRKIRQITQISYENILEKHLYPTLGHLLLDKLTAAHLDALYRQMQSGSKPLGTRVVRYTHTLVHGMLNQALKWGKLGRNVALAATPPSSSSKKMRVWTPEEAVKFLETAQHDRLHAVFYLGLFAGLRRAELMGLRWQDIDFVNSELTVNQGAVEVKEKGSKMKMVFNDPKTAQSMRTIALSDDTMLVLLAHREQQNKERELCGDAYCESDLVFRSSLGTPLNSSNLARSYKACIRLAGVTNIRLHDLRHTSASLGIRRGDQPKVVAERLGHTSVVFTLNTYVKTFADQRRKAALGMANLHSDKSEKKSVDNDEK